LSRTGELPETGKQNHGQLGVSLLEAECELVAVHPRHPEVGEHGIEAARAQFRQSLLAIDGHGNFISQAAKKGSVEMTEQGVIIDAKQLAKWHGDGVLSHDRATWTQGEKALAT
jgi:hypothetical protein